MTATRWWWTRLIIVFAVTCVYDVAGPLPHGCWLRVAAVFGVAFTVNVTLLAARWSYRQARREDGKP